MTKISTTKYDGDDPTYWSVAIRYDRNDDDDDDGERQAVYDNDSILHVWLYVSSDTALQLYIGYIAYSIDPIVYLMCFSFMAGFPVLILDFVLGGGGG